MGQQRRSAKLITTRAPFGEREGKVGDGARERGGVIPGRALPFRGARGRETTFA